MPLPTSIHEIPFVRLLIPLMAGIALQTQLHILPHNEWSLLLLPTAVLLQFTLRIIAHRPVGLMVYSGTVATTMLCAGLTIATTDKFGSTLDPVHPADVLLRIADAPQARPRSIRAEGVVEGIIDDGGQIRPANEPLLCYFKATDTAALNLKHGDIVAMRIDPTRFAPPSNPYQFDFAAYMQQRGILFSTYIDSAAWQHVSARPNALKALAIRMRNNLLSIFERANLQPDELAVISALTVGYKELLDDTLRRTYSAAGAMHILAVSGLHVGVIYGIVLLVLSLFPKIDKRLKLIISLICLWLFALITGFSPSVLRATAMFSLMEIGRCMGYRTNSYNTLAAVAFALLIADHRNLYNLGFQLSFLAVLSIMMFYPHIRNLLYIKTKLLRWIWELMAVSIAAQIGTLPITLLNFGQFSNYFLLTNMMATPMASIIIYLAVLLLIVSPIQPLFWCIGKALGFTVWLLNSGLRGIEALPGALSQGLYCSPLQSILLVAAIATLALYLERKHLRNLRLTLIFLCLFVIIQHTRNTTKQTNELVVFDVPQRTVVALRMNGMAMFFDTDTTPTNTIERNSFQLSGYAERYDNTSCHNLGYTQFDNTLAKGVIAQRANGIAIISANNFRVAIPYNDSCKHLTTSRPFDVNVLVVNRHASRELLNLIHPQTAIIDATLSQYRLSQLSHMIMAHNIQVYNVQDQGAYQISLPTTEQ